MDGFKGGIHLLNLEETVKTLYKLYRFDAFPVNHLKSSHRSHLFPLILRFHITYTHSIPHLKPPTIPPRYGLVHWPSDGALRCMGDFPRHDECTKFFLKKIQLYLSFSLYNYCFGRQKFSQDSSFVFFLLLGL